MPSSRLNIIVIIMDDLGYHDLACHGNPHTKTPHLDQMYQDSVRLEGYRSGPVCTPARAALMTGRYPYRTRAIDTYCGRSMMDPEEVTLAERLREAGYATCLSGKWHLGDSYPLRPMDKGFQESLNHNGGGLCQPANLGKDDYFDPDLMHNGALVPSEGYCTDIFAEHTMQFIRDTHAAGEGQPFFCYVGTNAPHTPAIAKPEDAQPYLDQGLSESLSHMYGMVDNIDWNVGRILELLDELGIAEETLVVYTSDHGPGPENHDRYMGELRGWKASVFEGGLKVPCFLRWKGAFESGKALNEITHPMDLYPTLLNAAGIEVEALSEEEGIQLDGLNLLPWLKADEPRQAFPQRNVVLQWHRGDVPVCERQATLYRGSLKWLRVSESDDQELYDLSQDPSETHNLVAAQPETAQAMREAYVAWFEEVSSTRPDNYDPPRMVVGHPAENPIWLNANDWRVLDGVPNWNEDLDTCWWVEVAEAGEYEMHLKYQWTGHYDQLSVESAAGVQYFKLTPWMSEEKVGGLTLNAGPSELRFRRTRFQRWDKAIGVRWVGLRRV